MNLELHTGRLQLTPLAPADLDLALEMWTDPEVVKYVGDLMNKDTIRKEMFDWIRRGGKGRHLRLHRAVL